MNKIFSLLNKSEAFESKKISGAKIGEKALIVAGKGRGVIFSADFVEAVKLKRALIALGKPTSIVACGREVGVDNDENLKEFLSALAKFYSKALDFVIFLPNAAITKFDIKKFLSPLHIEKSDTIKIESLTEKLVSFGYTRVSLVTSEGEFAVRGDIFDIFPIGSELPIRCDFFDEEIENMSFFDPNDMKMIEKIEKYDIFPSILEKGRSTACDICDVKVIDQSERFIAQTDLILSSFSVMENFEKNDYAFPEQLAFSLEFCLSGGYDLRSGTETSYLHNFSVLAQDIESFKPTENKIILFAGDEISAARLKNFLLGSEIAFSDYETSDLSQNGVYVSKLFFPNSFMFYENNLIGIGSDCLTKQKKSVLSNARKDVFYQPKIGEYVVHDFHGIGKCMRVERMKLADFEKDYFVIEYRNGGMLYLPSEQASSISAYIGSEENPRMNSLGGKEFESMKARVKEKLEGFAQELMKIYKEREEAKGFSFKSDEFLESAFASEFEFEETADQTTAIFEVLSDMESNKIMDRLLCGDVGFGKTEVAFRAAFRAIINQKQVAMLCPTTILSEQHFLSATKRFANFGVKIEVLNRFKTQKETKIILDRLEKGEIDLVIGTHKLLSANVKFKNLGLLIVDEEQRFGVAAKEKLKNIRKNVDVLSLSATPIPRTLHMSLSGIRDISVISTPPKDRLPIQTYVTSEDDELIRSIILRELARGGKTFVIYNRVQTISIIARHIAKLVPEAKIGVAHGQMQERQLHQLIDQLYNNQFNVLVSTTLIENGIDLPSANSMIIFDADFLGLSQLYQLRGRIGRGDKLSYAYLFYKDNKSLTADAYKRLEAIKEFRELGSGFKISMRDLEIRGAGNVFGKEQHGHIEKVGYDMYVKLLGEAISEIRGDRVSEIKPIKIDIPIDAYISENYITSKDERVSYYVKISECRSREELNSILQSLSDGYGDVPAQIINLLKIALIKNLASLFDVFSIKVEGEARISLYKSSEVADKRLVSVLKDFGASLRFENLPIIKLPRAKNIAAMLDVLIEFFERAKLEKT